MNKVLVFLNSPSLGGAERSMILQLKNLTDHRCAILIPYVNSKSEADNLLVYIKSSLPGVEPLFVKFPKSLYSFSRNSKVLIPFNVVFAFFSVLLILFRLVKLRVFNFQTWWINGNKIGFPVLILAAMFLKSNNKLFYHLRDYPFNNGIYKFLWAILRKNHKFNCFIVSNSYSVQNRAKEVIKNKNVKFMVCYNPVEINFQKQRSQGPGNIVLGLASMLVEWKGIHFILNFMNIYKDKLKEIGVRELKIYGENIYLTQTNKSRYKDQLLEVCKNNEMVVFEGVKSPDDIFSNIDILFHPSLDMEPFGRVIAEGFRARIPVVSTALGGSAELIQDGLNGFKCIPNDYANLFKIISKLTEEECYSQIVNNAVRSDVELQEQQNEFWKQIKEITI